MPPFRPGQPRGGGRAQPLAIATAAYAVVLVFATHHPRPEVLIGTGGTSDKTLHFIAYAVLAALATGTLAAARRLSPATAALVVAALAGFGAIDEITQPWFSRTTDPLDWVSDCGGAAAGVLAAGAVAAVWRCLGTVSSSGWAPENHRAARRETRRSCGQGPRGAEPAAPTRAAPGRG